MIIQTAKRIENHLHIIKQIEPSENVHANLDPSANDTLLKYECVSGSCGAYETATS